MAISLLTCAPPAAEAGFVKVWQIDEAAAAPVLVVGRVLAVQRGEPVPDGKLPWTVQTSYMTAEIEVLRSRGVSGEPLAVDRIEVHFLAYGPIMVPMVNATPLPNIKSGDLLVLPLKENPQPLFDAWNLTADSGMDLVIPARAEIPASDPPASARAFLDREISNALSRGNPTELFGVACYLSQQRADLVGEFTPLLESAVGDDRRRWAGIATSLLAGQGIPQPSAADLLSGKAQPKDWPGRGSLFLAQVALQKLKASPETDALLIATAIADLSLGDAWGFTNVLLEFADNPLTTEGVRKALRDDMNGSSFVASAMVHSGHSSILPEALTRALKVADRPDADPTDLQGAAALLRDYGSDQDLRQLAALVRKYQTQDQNFYNTLWQYSTEAGNPRETRVLAVVLQDRRIDFGDYRYCDYAVEVLAKAAKQNFGAGGKTLKERDDAVSRALAWISAQGFPQ